MPWKSICPNMGSHVLGGPGRSWEQSWEQCFLRVCGTAALLHAFESALKCVQLAAYIVNNDASCQQAFKLLRSFTCFKMLLFLDSFDTH